MRRIVSENPALREELLDEALKLFQDMGQVYKVELLSDLKPKAPPRFPTKKPRMSIRKMAWPQFIALASLLISVGPHVMEV